MDLLLSFAIGIISSLVATLLAGVLLVFFSKKMRWFATGILSRLSKHDVDFVFSNKDEALSEIRSELSRSKKIYLLTSRGNELKREPFFSLFNNKPKNRKVDMRIILPKIKLDKNEFNFVQQREDEMSKFDKAYGQGKLVEDIRSNIDYLERILYNDDKDENDIKFRLANFPHVGRILITDDYLFYTPYNKDRHGETDPVIKFRRGVTYKNYFRMFDLIWKSSPKDE